MTITTHLPIAAIFLLYTSTAFSEIVATGSGTVPPGNFVGLTSVTPLNVEVFNPLSGPMVFQSTIDVSKISNSTYNNTNGYANFGIDVGRLAFLFHPGFPTGAFRIQNDIGGNEIQGNTAFPGTLDITPGTASTLNFRVALQPTGGKYDVNIRIEAPGNAGTALFAESILIAQSEFGTNGRINDFGFWMSSGNISAFQYGASWSGTATSALLPGDATRNGRVDAFDLNILAANWQQPTGATWSTGDFTGDGEVDAFDLNILAANWQSGTATTLLSSMGPITPIPEPATLPLLLATSLLLLRRSPSPRASAP